MNQISPSSMPQRLQLLARALDFSPTLEYPSIRFEVVENAANALCLGHLHRVSHAEAVIRLRKADLLASPERLLAVALHEFAHVFATHKGMHAFTTRGKHTPQFKAVASLVGLTTRYGAYDGWGHADLSAAGREMHAPILDALRAHTPPSDIVPYECHCKPPTRIWLSQARPHDVACTVCGASFQEASRP
mgnify:CR=1 FL=1